MRYPYLLFDVGGTLVGPRESYGAVYRRALLRSGIDVAVADLDRAIFASAKAMNAAIAPGVDRFSYFDDGEDGYWKRFVARVFEELGLDALPAGPANSLLDSLRHVFTLEKTWRAFDDALPTLRALQARNVRMAVVSNWDSRLARVLDAVGMTGFFDFIGCSAIEGSEKPAPLLFERALERLGAEPSEALHIGDVPELDLVGAHGADVDAVLIDRDRRHVDAGHRRIDSLSELLD